MLVLLSNVSTESTVIIYVDFYPQTQGKELFSNGYLFAYGKVDA